MKLVAVKELPGKRTTKKSLKVLFDEFLNMNVQIARVDLSEHDYKSVTVAYGVLNAAIKRWVVPITVTRRGDEIYFINRTM